MHEKGRRYQQFRELHADFRRLRQACDLWTAAFFAKLKKPAPGTPERIPTTDHVLRALRGQPGTQGVLKTALELANEHRFFHWPLEFGEVFAGGGFDVALGNPPWDVSQLSEEEFFETRDLEVARLAGAQRKAAIKRLKTSKEWLWQEYSEAKRAFEAINEFLRASGRFTLTARSKINTSAVFAETFLNLISKQGRLEAILPRGILSNDTTKERFLSVLKRKEHVISSISFENEEFIFPGIANVVRFCLMILAGGRQPDASARFAFYVRRIDQVEDERRFFSLSRDDFRLLNPNICICSVFRSQADSELTKKIYRRVPVLVDESKGDAGNPWRIMFRQGLFNMTSDSGLFRTHAKLRDAGGQLEGMVWTLPGGKRWVPLYEGKFVWH